MSKNMNVNVRKILSERMTAEQKRIKEADKLLPANQVKATTTKIVTTTLLATTIVGSATPAFADNRIDNSPHKIEGFISITEEVGANGTGGTISSGVGDYGGVSYGLTQLSTTVGSAKEFVNNHLKPNHPDFYKFFKDAGEPGTDSFNKAWTNAYNYNPGKFEDIQLEYKEKVYVNPAHKNIKESLGIDMLATRARLELLHSTAVQYGKDGTTNLLIEAGVNKDMDEEELLTKICDYKINNVERKFRSSSEKVRKIQLARYKREKKALLKIAKEEQGPSLEDVMNGKHIEVDNSKEIVDTAKSYLNQGTTYKMGGKNTEKLDCSGYVSLVYQDLGLDIDEMMTNAGKFRNDSKEIKREELKEGDLVFWHDLTGKKHAKVFHIGIYVGNDTVVDCSIDHNGVGTRKLSSLQDKKGDRYFTFGRYEGVNKKSDVIEVSKEEEFDSIIKVDESIKEEVKKEDELNSSIDNDNENSDGETTEPEVEDEEENSIIDTDNNDNENSDGETTDSEKVENEEENSIIDTDNSDDNENSDSETTEPEVEDEDENSIIDTDTSDDNENSDSETTEPEVEDEEENSIIDTDNSDDETSDGETTDSEKVENEEENSIIDTDTSDDNENSDSETTEPEVEDEEENSIIDTDNSDDETSDGETTDSEKVENEEENSIIETESNTNGDKEVINSDKTEQDDTKVEQESSDSDKTEQDNTKVEQDNTKVEQESSDSDKTEQDNTKVEQESSDSDKVEQDNTKVEQESSDSDKVEQESSDSDKVEQDNTKVEQESSDSDKKEPTSNSENKEVDDNSKSSNSKDGENEKLNTDIKSEKTNNGDKDKSTSVESQNSNTNENVNANTNTNSNATDITTEYEVVSSDDLKIQEIKSSLEDNMFTKLTNFFSA